MSGRFDISLDWYAVFCAVAKAGNVTAAAEALHVSQPAVSMAIRQLEGKLGHALFLRAPRGMSLTAEGAALYLYLERALSLVDAGERKLEEMARLESGRISIAASDTLCGRYLLPHLEEYNRRYPNIAIEVMNKTSPETLDIVRSGKADIGFVNLPVETDAGIEVTQCLSVHDCLICGARYSALARDGLALSGLAQYPLLMLERASATRCSLDEYAAASGVMLTPAIELGSSDLLVRFARINLGIAFVIREFAEDYIDGKTLFEIPLSPPPPERAVGMVRLKNMPVSIAADKFMELLQNKKRADIESHP